jgi:hypothetical protein
VIGLFVVGTYAAAAVLVVQLERWRARRWGR